MERNARVVGAGRASSVSSFDNLIHSHLICNTRRQNRTEQNRSAKKRAKLKSMLMSPLASCSRSHPLLRICDSSPSLSLGRHTLSQETSPIICSIRYRKTYFLICCCNCSSESFSLSPSLSFLPSCGCEGPVVLHDASPPAA